MSSNRSPGPFASMPPPPEDDDPFSLWQRHVDAGRIGTRPEPSAQTVARRIGFSEALLGRKLRPHEGGTR